MLFRSAALTSSVLFACGGSGGASDGDGGFDASSDRCQFEPAQPQYLVEGETIEVTLRCGTGAELDDLELENLPAGASFEPTQRRLTWTPGLDQAAVYDLFLRSRSLEAEGTLKIAVADAFDHPDNVEIQDKSRYSLELGLPVLFIDQEPGEDYGPATITYRGRVFQAEAKIRGKSSRDYPKKSYSLRFDTFEAFAEEEFADFPNRTRVILTSTFDDNAYFRQRMSFDLWKALEPTITVEAYSAVVYRGTEYRGIYTVTDFVSDELLTRSGLSKNGNLYKAETHDANFRLIDKDGDAKLTLHQGYSKTEGDPKQGQDGAFADLEDLVAFVAKADDETFNAEIADRIDVDDYAAWWMHVTFLLAYDSAGKNSYHYHDQTRAWRVSPWDFNASLGQSWETSRQSPDDDTDFSHRNRLFERLRAHPTLGPVIAARYREALDSGPFALDSLLAMVDSYTEEMTASAERDWSRWEAEYRSFSRWSSRNDFTSHQEEVAYLREWLRQRWNHARGSLAHSCAKCAP